MIHLLLHALVRGIHIRDEISGKLRLDPKGPNYPLAYIRDGMLPSISSHSINKEVILYSSVSLSLFGAV